MYAQSRAVHCTQKYDQEEGLHEDYVGTLGEVLYLQLPVRFIVKLQYSIRAVVGSASESEW